MCVWVWQDYVGNHSCSSRRHDPVEQLLLLFRSSQGGRRQGDAWVPFQLAPGSTATLPNRLLASSSPLCPLLLKVIKEISLATVLTLSIASNYNRGGFYCKPLRICHFYGLLNWKLIFLCASVLVHFLYNCLENDQVVYHSIDVGKVGQKIHLNTEHIKADREQREGKWFF